MECTTEKVEPPVWQTLTGSPEGGKGVPGFWKTRGLVCVPLSHRDFAGDVGVCRLSAVERITDYTSEAA
ncbi:hypothetical protein AAE478_003170 [Parahypoxylon ruwenzoriense]